MRKRHWPFASAIPTIFFTSYLVIVQSVHLEFTIPELIRTFGVSKHDHVPEYQLIETHREWHADSLMDRPRPRQLRFTAWNTSFLIDLDPNRRLISPHMISVIREGNQNVTFEGLPTHLRHDCHFHGTVISHGGIRASISDCNELMGMIVHEDHFLIIQTLPDRIRRHPKRRHKREGQLVYKRQAALINPLEHWSSSGSGLHASGVRLAMEGDSFTLQQKQQHFDGKVNGEFGDDGNDEDPNETFCDVSKDFSMDLETASLDASKLLLYGNLLEQNYTLTSAAKLDSLFIFPQLDPITLEIGLFLDSQLYEHFKREFTADPDQHLTDFSLALINNVHVLYQQPSLSPNLEIVIVRFEMWKTQPLPLATELHKNGQAQTLLDSFCRHQARINPGTDLTDPGHWDHGVLLTGYDIYHTTSSVAGVAPVGRMCDELFACSLVEGLHLGRSFVLAHEMGHNMGMVHDGVQNQCGRSCCLMSAVNGAGKTTWSSCSVREFNSFLLQLDESGRGNCLRDPAESVASHDHLKDGRLPGQRFTADQQCSYFWGRDFSVEIPNGRSYEDICRILWCGNTGSTISTAHPALEGSWCGGTKWCHEGQCELWHPAMGATVPSRVDGQWSDWTSAERLCPITQCQISGSISLISQLRTCTNPAPNNGGKACDGAKVRGLVCGNGRTTCEGFSRQEYSDRLCSAILHDPNRPDRQLSGLSFLHGTQPCKIWCHVRDSELIRNKGQFPNGSPCGPEQHCIGGVCLSLACSSRAVVEHPSDCPSDEEVVEVLAGGINRVQGKRPRKWEPWTAWSECSASCGDHGVQKRHRKCRAFVETECAGKATEVRACDPQPSACERYAEWRPWSSCSVSCGGNGTRRRDRDCLSGRCNTQPLAEEEPCGNVACPAGWSAWREWSECSASCGRGQRRRERSCVLTKETGENIMVEAKECDGETSQEEGCSLQECPTSTTTTTTTLATTTTTTTSESLTLSISLSFSSSPTKPEISSTTPAPSTSSPAESDGLSKTPAGGQRRSALGSTVEGEWGDWMPCSVSCGIGFQFRERFCSGGDDTNRKLCTENNKQARTCHSQDCSRVVGNGVLSEWSLWGACSQTCGEGIQRRVRRCLNEHCARASTPEERMEEQKKCALGPCPSWTGWSPWSKCASCSVFETRRRTRRCTVKITLPSSRRSDTKEVGGEETELGEDSCAGAPVEYDTCERTCHDDSGVDPGSGEVDSEIPTTTVTSETSSSLLLWTLSETTVLSTEQTSSSPETLSETTKIAPESTSSSPESSSETTKIAPESTSSPPESSLETTTVTSEPTLSPPELSSETTTEGSLSTATPERTWSWLRLWSWSEWGEWGQCSQSCGGGRQTRTRSCTAKLVFLCGDGYSKEERPCNTKRKCSEDKRKDEEEEGEGDAHKLLVPVWSDWSGWSACSCFSLSRYRRRYCRIRDPTVKGFCSGSIIDQQRCRPTECQSLAGGWSKWSAWSRCSQECGNGIAGHRIRNRMCSNPLPSNRGAYCVGYSFDQLPCEPKSLCTGAPVDGQWSEWTEWTDCSNPCFNGQRSRTRYCANPRPKNGGQPCVGGDFELQACTDPQKCLVHSPAPIAPNGASTDALLLPSESIVSATSELPLFLGTETSNETHGIVRPGWSAWSAWTLECSASCGFAFKSRHRFCNTPPPTSGSRPCSGLVWMTSVCRLAACAGLAVDGHWSAWTKWTDTCAWPCLNHDGINGTANNDTLSKVQLTRTRTRRCIGPSNGGQPCFGRSSELSMCPQPKTQHSNISTTTNQIEVPSDSCVQTIQNYQLTEMTISRMIL